jgi:H/ACA ribonucleoprotein complex subunit 2
MPKATKGEEGAAVAAAADNAAGAEEADVDRLLYRCPIASPISSDKPKLTKKLYSLIHKAVTADKKRGISKGIKEVTKVIRKNKAGAAGSCLVVLGADVSPYDVVAHFPVLLEEKSIPYVWVPSRSDLGQATHCRRATSVVLLRSTAENKESFDKCVQAIQELGGVGVEGN